MRLGCFRDLNTAQLEDFVTDESALKPHSRHVAIQRSLARLKARGLIAPTRRLIGGPGGDLRGSRTTSLKRDTASSGHWIEQSGTSPATAWSDVHRARPHDR